MPGDENQESAPFDARAFIEKMDRMKKDACASGNHSYGPGWFSGGCIYFKCRHCGHLDKQEDTPFTI